MSNPRSKMSQVTAMLEDLGGPKAPRPRGSGAQSAPVMLAHFSQDFDALQRANETLKAAQGKVVMTPLAHIYEGPFHLGALEEERVAGLVRNLEHNRLMSPVVLRLVSERLELVAGRHRLEAYRRLGREAIESVITEMPDDEAVALVFFDNLLAPQLSDYQRYLGFAQLQSQLSLSYAEMARRSGYSKSVVTGLMSFGRLPEGAIHVIAGASKRFGYNLAGRLASLCEESPELTEHIVAACREVASGSLSQDAVEKWLLARGEAVAKGAAETTAETGEGTFPAVPSDIIEAPGGADVGATKSRATVSWDGRDYAYVSESSNRRQMTVKVARGVDAGEMQAIREAVLAVLEEHAKRRANAEGAGPKKRRGGR